MRRHVRSTRRAKRPPKKAAATTRPTARPAGRAVERRRRRAGKPAGRSRRPQGGGHLAPQRSRDAQAEQRAKREGGNRPRPTGRAPPTSRSEERGRGTPQATRSGGAAAGTRRRPRRARHSEGAAAPEHLFYAPADARKRGARAPRRCGGAIPDAPCGAYLIYGQYSVMAQKLLAEITHTLRVKTYPNGTRIFQCASSPIFRESGWELSNKWDSEKSSTASRDGKAEDVERSKRRARSRLADIARSNDFTYFVTLTLDPAKVDRYDPKAVTKKLNNWLDNRVRRNGLRYVIVPELHKDGAIHFHGFINDALPVVSSGTFDVPGSKKPRKPRSAAQARQWLSEGAHEVFNLPAWGLGFTTAIRLYGDYSAAVGYVCKYISKADEKIGGRWYYSGGDLLQPSIELFDAEIADFEQLETSRRYRIDRLGVDVVEWEVKEVL